MRPLHEAQQLPEVDSNGAQAVEQQGIERQESGEGDPERLALTGGDQEAPGCRRREHGFGVAGRGTHESPGHLDSD